MQHSLRDVFTPCTAAKLTFVERDGINDRLVSALQTPGKQIVVYGHSGSGKTTILLRKLEQLYEAEPVRTSCMGETTFDALLIAAFGEINKQYTSEITLSKRRKFSASLEPTFHHIKAQLGFEGERSTTVKVAPVLPPQLTPQTLAHFLGEMQTCWIIDDFHKVA